MLLARLPSFCAPLVLIPLCLPPPLPHTHKKAQLKDMSSSSSTVASLQAKLGEIQKERQILEKKLGHARGGSGGSGGGGRGNRQVILDGGGGGGGGGGSRGGGPSDGTMYPRHGRPTSPRRDGGLLSRVGEKRGRLASAVSVPGGEEEGEVEEGEVPDQEGGRTRKTARRDESGGRGGRHP